jgi:hypothetical protein
MALGSNQPLTEMSTRNRPGGRERPTRKADNLTAICEPTVSKMWESRRLTTLWTSMACYRDSFTLHFFALTLLSPVFDSTFSIKGTSIVTCCARNTVPINGQESGKDNFHKHPLKHFNTKTKNKYYLCGGVIGVRNLKHTETRHVFTS